MKNEIQCSVVNDLLPLYADELTSEDTSSLIQAHLEECEACQKVYQAFKTELNTSANTISNTTKKEVNYLKKINTYQTINLILGAIISFLLGACLPVLKIGIPVLLGGKIPEYYLARLQIAWHIGLLKMVLSGIIVCGCYLLVMFCIRKKIKNWI